MELSQWGFCWVNTAWEYIPRFLDTKPPKKLHIKAPLHQWNPLVSPALQRHQHWTSREVKFRGNPIWSTTGSVGFLEKPQRRIGTAKAYTGRPEDVSWEVIKKNRRQTIRNLFSSLFGFFLGSHQNCLRKDLAYYVYIVCPTYTSENRNISRVSVWTPPTVPQHCAKADPQDIFCNSHVS